SINMYTKTVALEQVEKKTGHKIIAFSPGIMDTDMQGKIRESTYDEFIQIDTFKNYKEQNELRHPDTVADALYHILQVRNNLRMERFIDCTIMYKCGNDFIPLESASWWSRL